MIEVIRDIHAARSAFRRIRSDGRSLGLVPTMGALHAGHTSLIERARTENDKVAVSIFVNPTQYDDPSDLENYPRTFEADLAKVEAAGGDLVFAPADGDVYHDAYRFKLSESEFSTELEGAHRAGHFDGVLTVVLKLFNIVQPDRAYFGEKDWQQLQLVREMAAAFFHQTEIVAGPIIREPDGLALSSRNIHLTGDERRLAPEFYRILSSGSSTAEMRRQLKDRGFVVDYVESRGDRMLGAVRLGEVRLIDNVQI